MARPSDPDEIRANVKKLKPFGMSLSIDSLAGNDITKWNQILTLSYNRVIVKLLMDRERIEFQKRYSQITQQDGRN